MSIKFPNADIIFEALQVLDGYWTEAHIRTTAEGVPYAGKNRPAIVTSVAIAVFIFGYSDQAI